MDRMRSRLARLALVVIAPLLLLELALRVAGPHVPGVAPLLYDPKVVHRYDEVGTLEDLLDLTVLGYHPNTRFVDFVLNSKSFRTREYTEEKTPGTLRILAIGDSFTFAGGVPFADGWPALLEARMQERTSARVEVINLGIPAVGPEFEMRLWELEGAKLDADVVVLGFVVGSNFFASAMARRYRTWPERFAHRIFVYRLIRNAVLLNASRPEGARRDPLKDAAPIPDTVGGLPLAEIVPGFDYRYDPFRPGMSQEAFDELQRGFLTTCTGVGMQRQFDYAAQTLLRFRSEVVASGTEFVVLICPAELQASPESLRRLVGPEATPDVDVPQRFLRDLFEREGVRHLDLLPAFREAAPRGALYGLCDSHWNPQGNALAAEELANYLAQPPEPGRPWPWAHVLSEDGDR